MVIFVALFIVITTILLGGFRQRIQEFIQENVLGRLFRLFSHNHNVRTIITENTEAGKEVEASTPSPSSPITKQTFVKAGGIENCELFPLSMKADHSMRNLPQSLFPTFNGENYDSWSIKMRAYLMSRGLWDLVENGYDNGDNSKTESSKDVEAKEMHMKDAEALLMILQAIPDSMVSRFANAKTSKEAWTILNQKYHADKKENLSVNQNVPKRQHKESGGDIRDNINAGEEVEVESSVKAEKRRRISNPEDFSNVLANTENVLGTLNQNVIGDIRDNTNAWEDVEESTPSQSSPKTSTGSEFEVFLSFHGEDTRKGFTGHLYEGLQLRGVSTFKDDVNLDKGKEINRLLEYIEKSKIFVVILSEHFADSKWCLKEVTKSVECRKEIIPVFFGVEPSDVRNQRGSFEAAFKKHESNEAQDQEKVKKWREALKFVGNLSGFTLEEKKGDETQLKLAIIQSVLDKVNGKRLEVAKHPIGIETRLQDVVEKLESGGINGVRVVGIYGMGGLGKTTIARAVYNEYLTKGFNDTSCFLSSIREKCEQHNGLVDLQKQFIGDVFKQKDISLSDVAQGKIWIRDTAKNKRVLLILDDIESTEQLEALAGKRDWFGSGSVIIITTRDKKVLVAHNVKEHEIYEPAVLNEEQSKKLFLQHAFSSKEPEGDYLQLSNEVIVAAAGLPLTLEVLGSLLTCDMDVHEWKYTLEKLKKIPPEKVKQRLKLSYDRLDIYEKKIFLDISCLFIGRSKQYATYLWEDCGWCPDRSIKVLEQRSLIKIDEKSREFWMHDQIRDMGRAIVVEESSGNTEKQSRLWNSKDSFNLLQRKVPKSIAAEGIRIIPERDSIINAECFQNMADLRYFDARHLDFQGTLDCFPSDLKWLELWKCKFDSPPSDHLNLEQLVILELYETNYMEQIIVQQLPFKAFKKLKVFKIDDPTIMISPDFTNIPCLVELSLSGLALTTIDESIGELKKLTYLEISRCRDLEKLPDSIGSMSSLEVLSVTYCQKIMFLPEQLGDIRSLKKLDLSCNSGIVHLPDSICKLSLLKFLILSGCINFCSLPEKLGGMENLKELFLDFTKIKVIPDSVGELKNLERLFLRMCYHLCSLPEGLCDMKNLKELIIIDANIKVLPDSIGQLKNLERLSLCTCHPRHLYMLLSNCLRSLLERLDDMENLRELILDGTIIQVIPDSVGQLKNLERLSLKDCYYLRSLPERLGNMKNLRELILDRT